VNGPNWLQRQMTPATGGAEPAVHAGYTTDRRLGEYDGRQRSPRGSGNRRPTARYGSEQAARQEVLEFSLPAFTTRGVEDQDLPQVPILR
jgi:hypothetical protein